MAVRLHGRSGDAPGEAIQLAPPTSLGVHVAQPVRRRVTPGRLAYYVVLVGGVTLLAWKALTVLLYASAAGAIERPTYRLAPRERGRISRIPVSVGQRVATGDALVWLDHAAGEDAAGSPGFLSDASMRAAARLDQLHRLRQRRHELERQRAYLAAAAEGARHRARDLGAEAQRLREWHASAERLLALAAATEAEVTQVALRLATAERERASAASEASVRSAELSEVRAELVELDRSIRESATLAAAAPAEAGVIRAPHPGRVAWIAHSAGEVVGPDDPVVVVIDESSFRIRAFVAPEEARSFAPGVAVRVRLPTGEGFDGRVTGLMLLASPGSQPGPAPGVLRPADPAPALLIAEVALLAPSPDLPEWSPTGAPCEVRARRAFWRRP
jgi:HlyD family secretion protein